MFTHRDRIFVNKNIDVTHINTQLLATCDTWSKWFMVNRSVNTSVDHRSYAQVLKNSSNSMAKHSSSVNNHEPKNASNSLQTVYSKVHCVPANCIPECISHKSSINCKGLSYTRNSVPKGQPCVQEFSLPLQNRYEVYIPLYSHSTCLCSRILPMNLYGAIKTKLGQNWVQIHAAVVLLMVPIL